MWAFSAALLVASAIASHDESSFSKLFNLVDDQKTEIHKHSSESAVEGDASSATKVEGLAVEQLAFAKNTSRAGPFRMGADGTLFPSDEEVIFFTRDDYEQEVTHWEEYDIRPKNGILDYFEAKEIISEGTLAWLDQWGTVALNRPARGGAPDDPRSGIGMTFTDFVFMGHHEEVMDWYNLLQANPSPTVRDLVDFFEEKGMNDAVATHEGYPWTRGMAQAVVETAFSGSDKKKEDFSWETACSPRVFHKAHSSYHERFWFASHDKDNNGALSYEEVEQIIVDFGFDLKEVVPGGEEAHMEKWERKIGKIGRGALKLFLGTKSLTHKSEHRQVIKDWMGEHGADTDELVDWRNYLAGELRTYKEDAIREWGAPDKVRKDCLCEGGFAFASPTRGYENEKNKDWVPRTPN